MVTVYEPAKHKVTTDCLHRSHHTRVRRRQKPDERNHQQTRIKLIRVVRLRERPEFLAVSAGTNIIEYRLPQRPPPFQVALEIELLDPLDRAIHRNPSHHF